MTEQEKLEKAIKGLKCCQDVHTVPPGWAQGCILCPYKKTPSDGMNGYACFRKMSNDILALLKAQETVKPIQQRAHAQGADDVWYECNECHGYLGVFAGQIMTCPDCGKKVKW